MQFSTTKNKDLLSKAAQVSKKQFKENNFTQFDYKQNVNSFKNF